MTVPQPCRPSSGLSDLSAETLERAGQAISRWYRKNARDLPWRRGRNPYLIWVSEVMLQQTRVETVIPYFERFVRAFPSINALALATQDAVLAHWSGLGFYHRARRLHRAAIILAKARKKLPRSAKELLELPGFGTYTSAAVASIAFSEVVAAVDGNVERVLSRWLALRGNGAAAKRQIGHVALSLLSREEPGLSNQALMDVGAVICTPKNPRCGECPLRDGCRARSLGLAHRLPPSRARSPARQRRAIAVLIRRDGAVLLCRRDKAADWMPGLWEIPWSAVSAAAGPRQAEEALWKAYGLRIRLGPTLGSARHTITSNRFNVDVRSGSLRGRLRGPREKNLSRGWFFQEDLDSLPRTGLTKKLLLPAWAAKG
jgi:A/G-specific adenine glycosylase